MLPSWVAWIVMFDVYVFFRLFLPDQKTLAQPPLLRYREPQHQRMYVPIKYAGDLDRGPGHCTESIAYLFRSRQVDTASAHGVFSFFFLLLSSFCTCVSVFVRSRFYSTVLDTRSFGYPGFLAPREQAMVGSWGKGGQENGDGRMGKKRGCGGGQERKTRGEEKNRGKKEKRV